MIPLMDPATEEQIASLKDRLEPRFRQLSKLYANILLEAGDQLPKAFGEVLDHLLVKLVIEAAIKDAKFDYSYVDLSGGQFPLVEEDVDIVEEIHLDQYLLPRRVVAAISATGKRFASPLTALRYAARHPNNQLGYPIAVIFEVHGERWHLVLHCTGSRRKLHVYRSYLDGRLEEEYRFLVVPR